MRLISILLKIYNRTRPPHQSNTEQYIFTPNIFNHYKIMIDRSKQIIPDSQAVVSCFDPEILKVLDSHGTFTINELLKAIKMAGHSPPFRRTASRPPPSCATACAGTPSARRAPCCGAGRRCCCCAASWHRPTCPCSRMSNRSPRRCWRCSRPDMAPRGTSAI